MRIRRHAVLIAILLLGTVRADAVVISGSNVLLDPDNSFPPGDVRLTVNQRAGAPFNPTSAWFDYDLGVLQGVGYNLDESADWYLVEEGDLFNEQNIENGDFTVVLRTSFPTANPPVPVGDEFFLGINTGEFDSGDTRNVFGWVKLRSEGGLLQMVDNAMSYNAQGIYVGTLIEVPEPAGIEILVLGLVAIGFVQFMQRRAARQF